MAAPLFSVGELVAMPGALAMGADADVYPAELSKRGAASRPASAGRACDREIPRDLQDVISAAREVGMGPEAS